MQDFFFYIFLSTYQPLNGRRLARETESQVEVVLGARLSKAGPAPCLLLNLSRKLAESKQWLLLQFV